MKYKDTKLIVLLSTLSGEEMSEFELFLESPYFKKGRDPLPLFKSVSRFYPEFKDSEFTEESVLKGMYPEAEIIDKKLLNNLRSLSSLLLTALEEFLYVNSLRSNIPLKNRTLLKEILDRNLLKNFPKYLNEAEDELNLHEGLYGTNNLERYHYEKLNSRYAYTTFDFDKYFVCTSDSIEYISAHFLFELFAIAKSRILGKHNENVTQENTFVEDILNSLNLDELLNIFGGRHSENLLRFQYHLFRFLNSGGDHDELNNAQKVFAECKKGLTRYELVYYYSELINMFQTRYIPVNRETKAELHSLMKDCLRDRAFKISDDDFMHPLFYRNVILCSDYLHECNWAYEFIEKYTSELRPELRGNMSLYSKALIDYRMGKYEESLSNISKVKYDLVAFKSDVKTLMLRIFYELRLENQALATADTARHYVKTAREFDEYYKQAYRNFLTYYMKLFKLNLADSNNRSSDAGLLERQIKEEPVLVQRAWLLEKAGELAKK